MIRSTHIPRRTFLRGLGTALALPAFEAMLPARALAAGNAKFPTRMAFVYIPNGVIPDKWHVKGKGSDFQFSHILEPLKAHRDDLLVFSGLAHTKARSNGDGAGDHARANATFLTGRQARKTAGADIRVGVSVDQLAAQKIGGQTRLPSLELSSDGRRMSGNCDSGYSCAYQFNLAWKSESTPLPPESDPSLVFERLFSNGNNREKNENRIRRERYKKSILDFVLEDAKALEKKLGYTDQRKLEEYLTSVRELEKRVTASGASAVDLPKGFKVPAGKPRDFGALLDHSMIVYGGAIGDGNRHTHHDLPVVLAGKANGAIKTGRHAICPRETPMANLFLNMLDIMGAPTQRMGDSTGRLKGLL